MDTSGAVYAWVTHEEAERGALPERVTRGGLYADLCAADLGREQAPADAHYLVRADARTGAIAGYA